MSSRGGDELRGQHGRQELVRDRRLRHQGETQQTASSLQWRHGQYHVVASSNVIMSLLIVIQSWLLDQAPIKNKPKGLKFRSDG